LQFALFLKFKRNEFKMVRFAGNVVLILLSLKHVAGFLPSERKTFLQSNQVHVPTELFAVKKKKKKKSTPPSTIQPIVKDELAASTSDVKPEVEDKTDNEAAAKPPAADEAAAAAAAAAEKAAAKAKAEGDAQIAAAGEAAAKAEAEAAAAKTEEAEVRISEEKRAAEAARMTEETRIAEEKASIKQEAAIDITYVIAAERKAAIAEARRPNKSAEENKVVADAYAAISDLGERAFQILVDLGVVKGPKDRE
jgi:hypothetical protein